MVSCPSHSGHPAASVVSSAARDQSSSSFEDTAAANELHHSAHETPAGTEIGADAAGRRLGLLQGCHEAFASARVDVGEALWGAEVVGEAERLQRDRRGKSVGLLEKERHSFASA